jgi:hypothetical protein
LDIIINSQFSNDKNKKCIILNHRILIERIFSNDKAKAYKKLREYIILFTKYQYSFEKELEELEEFKKLEKISTKSLIDIFNLPMHFYHFPINNQEEKQLFLESDLFQNIFFKNCFFDSPASF